MSYSFYGHSDDCAEVEGEGGFREEVCTDGNGSAVRWRIGDASGGMFVTAAYGEGDGAVWSFRVEQIDEDVPAPWTASVTTEHEYSLRVVVDCPRGTPLSYAFVRGGKAEESDVRVVP